jgi:translocation and assembly module TamB
LRDVGNKTSVRTSDDVVIVDAPRKEKKPLKSDIEVQVSVVMGKKVHVRVSGLDGQIQGNVNLTGRLPDKLLGKGMLKIAGGKYNSYGIKLDVVRGNIMFDNKPVDLALLDIMAIRTFNPGKFDEIKAGVTVTGTPLSPLIKLYSDPPMTDTDVLSYLVLGRPTKAGAETQQTALLLKSASAVLGVSKSGGIQDQIQHLLGVDTLEVQEGANRSFTTSRTSTVTGSTLNNSLMTVGKYLSPDLYISYGRSLFSDQYLVSARYSLSKKLELESKAGMETSVDLFYKIEFD